MKKPRVGTTYAGDLRMYVYSFFQDLGLETVYVPRSQLNFKELSTFSSDEWCYTMKLLYYDLLKALNMGADTLISGSNSLFTLLGPCKIPHLAEHRFEGLLRKRTKRDFDYHIFYFNNIAFKLSMMDVLRKMGYMKTPMDMLRFRKMFNKAKLKLKMSDEITTIMRKIRAEEKRKGETSRIYREFVQKLEKEQDDKILAHLFSETKDRLMAVEKDESREPKKIAIVGDYISIVSEFPCFDLENFISDKFSIEIYVPFSVYRYYFDKKSLGSARLNEFGKKYMKFWAGGSDQNTFRMILKALDYDVDGIIQLRNFGCMPEQMVVEVVNQMKEDIDDFPPFLSICFDEHTSSEGIKTRIEAFCNTLLRSKK
jgi:predicted nucleotide-binding protein (sugar kinase/HSP70/actin superfamily)